MAKEVEQVQSEGSNSSAMVFVGMVMFMVAILAFFFFGMPLLRGEMNRTVQQVVPMVPEKIDVNVQVSPPPQQ